MYSLQSPACRFLFMHKMQVASLQFSDDPVDTVSIFMKPVKTEFIRGYQVDYYTRQMPKARPNIFNAV